MYSYIRQLGIVIIGVFFFLIVQPNFNFILNPLFASLSVPRWPCDEERLLVIALCWVTFGWAGLNVPVSSLQCLLAT